MINQLVLELEIESRTGSRTNKVLTVPKEGLYTVERFLSSRS